MATVSRTFDASITTMFGAIVDPTTYPHWLVGARDIRRVDDGWPRPGTAFHHRVGLVGPLKVADLSKVLEVDEPELLSLEVRAGVFGRGRATFRLQPVEGEPHRTLVQLDEVPVGVLAHLRPVLDPLTARRNDRSLEQLEDFVIRGVSHRAPG